MGYKGAGIRWHGVKPAQSRRNRIAIVSVNTDESNEVLYFARCGVCKATTQYTPHELVCDVIECSDCGRLLEVKS